MKSLYAIEMDYRRAMAQASELENLASQLKTQANQNFPEILANVQSAWQGDNANEYVSKARTLQPKMMTDARNLMNVASTIRTVATNTYNAEKRAYEIAQQRTY